jgi:hypothetical protein
VGKVHVTGGANATLFVLRWVPCGIWCKRSLMGWMFADSFLFSGAPSIPVQAARPYDMFLSKRICALNKVQVIKCCVYSDEQNSRLYAEQDKDTKIYHKQINCVDNSNLLSQGASPCPTSRTLTNHKTMGRWLWTEIWKFIRGKGHCLF